MSDPDWPTGWVNKVTASIVICLLMLSAYQPVAAAAMNFAKTRKREANTKSWFFQIYEFIGLAIVPLMTVLAVILFLCDGEEFQRKSGDLWLKRHEAFTGIIVTFILDTIFIFLIKYIRRLSDKAERSYYFINDLIRGGLLVFGLVILTTIFKIDHSAGLVPYIISVYVIKIALCCVDGVVIWWYPEHALYFRLLNKESDNYTVIPKTSNDGQMS
jgi:uncharacterized membrane protein